MHTISTPTAERLATAVQALLAGYGDLTDETVQSADLTFEFPGVDGHAFLLPDFVLDTQGRLRLVECNGSNGAGTSVAGRDLPRVGHELEVMASRGVVINDDSVVITPESPDTRSTPEIRTRAMLRAASLSAWAGRDVRLTRAGSTLAPSPVAIWGPIPEIADRLSVSEDGLRYDGRPVVFLNNVNLLVELARRVGSTIEEVLALAGQHAPDPVHEGTTLALLSLDKVAQQSVAAITSSVTPVFAQRVSGSDDELITTALATAAMYGGAIIKPMAASGGTGVIPVDRTMTRAELESELEAAVVKLAYKYGAEWHQTCPMAVFEFIDIAPAVTDRGGHRWDLRLQVLATPERTLVTPLSARLCPDPIGPVLDRGSAVNNLTGRSTKEANRLPVADLVSMVGCADLLERTAGAAHQLAAMALTRPVW